MVVSFVDCDMAIQTVVVLHGGELAQDVANQISQKAPAGITVRVQSAEERPKKLIDAAADGSTVICYVMQTIENGAPTEEGGPTVRFFQRKTHAEDLLTNFRYTVLGVGDSNLLLDRQTTSAKDCNQVAELLDARLAALGGQRHHPLGLADERTGLTEVEPWIRSFWASIVGNNNV